jgi:hypothetical protein
MQQRTGARELGLSVATLGVLVHFVDPAPAAIATALIAAVAMAGMGALLGEVRPWRMPLIPMVLPALAAFSVAGIARLVGPVPWLGLVFVVAWAGVTWVVGLEGVAIAIGAGVRSAATPTAPAPIMPVADAGPADTLPAPATTAVRLRPKRRAEFDLPQIVAEPVETGPELPPHPRPVAVRATSLGLAFVAFAAIGGIVPGGFAGDQGSLGAQALAATVALDVLVGGLVGYRMASITRTSRYDRIVRILAFGQYAVPVGIAGAMLRVLALPRLFGPALLTLVAYVVTGVRESPEPVLYNRSLLKETALLGLVGALAIAWGLAVR